MSSSVPLSGPGALDVAVVVAGATLVVLLIVLLVMTARSFRIVHTGTTVLVERYGRYVRNLAPGMHMLSPFSEAPRRVVWSCNVEDRASGKTMRLEVDREYVDTRVTQLDLPAFCVFTSDRLQACVNCVLYFVISDPYAAVYNIDNLYESISSTVETTLRASICKLSLDDAIRGIAPIRQAVTEALQENQKTHGFTLTNFDLQSIDPPLEIIKATERAICEARTVEQSRRTAAADAEVAQQRAQTAQRVREIELGTELLATKASAERARCTAEAEADCARHRAEAEAASYAARRRAGVSDEIMVEELRLEAWKALAARQHGTLVVPYEAARFLGAGTLGARTAAIIEEHSGDAVAMPAPASGSGPMRRNGVYAART